MLECKLTMGGGLTGGEDDDDEEKLAYGLACVRNCGLASRPDVLVRLATAQIASAGRRELIASVCRGDGKDGNYDTT